MKSLQLSLLSILLVSSIFETKGCLLLQTAQLVLNSEASVSVPAHPGYKGTGFVCIHRTQAKLTQATRRARGNWETMRHELVATPVF